MSTVKKLYKILIIVLFVGLVGGMAQAETIIWVGENMADSLGVFADQGFVDLLEGAGYTVQTERLTMTGTPLTTEQLDILESSDLVIVSRTTTSGSYIDPAGWNSMAKPLILTTCYLSRANRWQWFNSDALIGDGNSGCPPFKAEIPDHPIFTGVTLDAEGQVWALDPAIGSGHTSLANWADAGDDGLIIATTVAPDSMAAVESAIAIVYWPTEAGFHPDTDQFAGAPRLLFQCGARESTIGLNPPHIQGMYNLTPDGDIMFLNAVAWMLGKEVGVAENPSSVLTEYHLAQNFPNPFNPSTTIEFSLPVTTAAKLCIYNMLGQEIVTLADQTFQAGTHKVSWNGLDNSGQTVESGIYLYKLETENSRLAKKMLLMK